MGIGSHVEVFGRLTQKKVADGSSHQIGYKAVIVKAVQDP